MYIPPGFTVITCEPVDEEAFRTWAVDNGGVWHPAWEGWNGSYHPARAEWDFGPYQEVSAKFRVLTEENSAEWIPRDKIHAPPQSTFSVELAELLYEEDEASAQCHSVLRSLFKQWDSYVYDLGIYNWVSALLRDLLPTERIIRYEPPPSPPTPWIWVNGRYTKNEAYSDSLDAAAAAHENQR